MFSLVPPQDGSKPKPTSTKKNITDDEKKELLVGYSIVSVDMWDKIPYKSHIRYVKKDGSFVRGGFVKNHWVTGEGANMIQLENNLNRKAPQYKTWAFALDDVQHIYKKFDKTNAIEVNVLHKKIERQRITINTLIDAVNSLERRVKALE